MVGSPNVRLVDLFPTNEPVPDQMIGRQLAVSELTTALTEGLHELVAGPRRNGKTTVCQAAMNRVRDEPGYYVVEADLFTLADLGELAHQLAASLVGNRAGWRRGAHALRSAAQSAAGLAPVIASAKLKASWGADVELALNPGLAKRDPRGSFEKALVMMQSAAERDGKHVVLYIDEFQEVAGPRQMFGDPDSTTQLMRGVLQQSHNVTCLFAGSVAHMMRDLFDDERRAFYKFGAWYDLPPITDEEWAEGLAERFERGGRPISEAGITDLLRSGESQARMVMLLAQQSFLAAVLADDGRVTTEHTTAAMELAMRADAAALEKDVEHLRELGRHAFPVCRAIALGEPPYRLGPPPRVKSAIDALMGAGFIEQRGTPGRGGWVVIDPLLRRKLAEL